MVEDGAAGEPPSDAGAVASARARIETCLAYSPSGRTDDADVRIAGNPVTEGYVEAILDPEARIARLRAEGNEERADAIAVRAGEVDRDSRQRILAGRRDLAEAACPWRPTGASASTRRSGGWVDRRARELIYQGARCPRRRPMTMTDVRSPERSSAAGPSLVEALERPRSRSCRSTGSPTRCSSSARGPQDRTHVLAVAGARGHARLGRAARAARLRVVPHLAARLIADRAHLEEVVLRLRNAGVREAFVIAGDASQPAGEFEGAAELLSAMAELPERPAEVGISGYPESHHFISDETTIEAMFEKEPMATYIVSQICFDADVIRTWIQRVRERGTSLPIWIGVPGAVETRKLLRTSLRIGLGQSVRFLRGQRGMLRRFLGPRTYTPTELLVALALPSPSRPPRSAESTSIPSTSSRRRKPGGGSSSTA